MVPVSKPNGNHTLTKDIRICYREPWQQHHWKSIRTAYSSSPYFHFYADSLEPLFNLRETSLIALNHKILTVVCLITGISISVEYTTEYFRNLPDQQDLRSSISPKKKSRLMFPGEYPQVFSHKHGFMPDLSILDLLFNVGPGAKRFL